MRVAAVCLMILVAAAPADRLPLRQGSYAPATIGCARASRADLLVYGGGNGSIGSPQASCSITRLERRGALYVLHDTCRDLASGETIEGGPTELRIVSPTRFTMGADAYLYCGPRAGR